MEPTVSEERDTSKKSRRGWGAIVWHLGMKALKTVRLRAMDIAHVVPLFLCVALSYQFIFSEMLVDEGVLFISIFRIYGKMIYALFVLSWLGVVYHGPGLVPALPDESAKSGIPDAMKAALTAGRFSRRPFGWRDGWCTTCNRWKPALAHHCNVCQRCCLWMDHHCMFTSQCVGFCNYRCFIVFLFYAVLLVISGFFTVCMHMITSPPWEAWFGMKLLALSLVIFFFSYVLQGNSRSVRLHIANGWHSHVMYKKYEDVLAHAIEVEKMIAGDRALEGKHLHQQLQDAIAGVLSDDKQLKGLFGFYGNLQAKLVFLERIFGEPPSWKWLLPMRSGGSGDALTVTACDEDACAAWACLAVVLVQYDKAVQANKKWVEDLEKSAAV